MVDWWAFGILCYEMLCGYPPFRADKPEATYKLIKKAKFECPPYMEKATQDFVGQLLVADHGARLGHDGDAEQVKKHKFFRGTDWFALMSRQVAPPKL